VLPDVQVGVLKSALGLKSELPAGVLDSHGKLLHQLAKVMQAQHPSQSCIRLIAVPAA
jgi:hypothetical protein